MVTHGTRQSGIPESVPQRSKTPDKIFAIGRLKLDPMNSPLGLVQKRRTYLVEFAKRKSTG